MVISNFIIPRLNHRAVIGYNSGCCINVLANIRERFRYAAWVVGPNAPIRVILSDGREFIVPFLHRKSEL